MRTVVLGGCFMLLLGISPAPAQMQSEIDRDQKMEICKFGAADQKLSGKEEQDFIRKCMANAPDQPRPQAKSKPGPK